MRSTTCTDVCVPACAVVAVDAPASPFSLFKISSRDIGDMLHGWPPFGLLLCLHTMLDSLVIAGYNRDKLEQHGKRSEGGGKAVWKRHGCCRYAPLACLLLPVSHPPCRCPRLKFAWQWMERLHRSPQLGSKVTILAAQKWAKLAVLLARYCDSASDLVVLHLVFSAFEHWIARSRLPCL